MFVGTKVDSTCIFSYFLDRSLWVHKNIMLACLFCFRINLCRDIRRLCLPFCSDWFDLRSMTLSSNNSLLAHVTDMFSLIKSLGQGDNSGYFFVPVRYCCTVRTQKYRWWSLCLIYTQNHSRVVFLLNFGLAYLPFLINNGYDKPSECRRSLYLVGRTWEKLKSA